MMNLLERFGIRKKDGSALQAKERLQIVLAHERAQFRSNINLQQLKEEILGVLVKYVNIEQEQVQVNFQSQGEYSVLELNVTLPEVH